MKAKVIFYSQKEIKPAEKTKFKKEFTGTMILRMAEDISIKFREFLGPNKAH